MSCDCDVPDKESILSRQANLWAAEFVRLSRGGGINSVDTIRANQGRIDEALLSTEDQDAFFRILRAKFVEESFRYARLACVNHSEDPVSDAIRPFLVKLR
jgi:hypothetical protein